MQNHASLFLRQSYIDNWADYERSLSKHQFTKWDYIVLTASNESQALAYQAQIDYRKENCMLPDGTHFAVVADPDGKRVGSGGATLNVLKYIREVGGSADCFDKKRILVIHSGGDSKRVPQYSAGGKLFSPVPRLLPNGKRSTLFDEFIIGMSGVPNRIVEGLLVLAGDVLLLFNPLQIDFMGSDAAAISMKSDVQTGKNHGVFLPDSSGNIQEFLHKQSVETLTKKGAVNAHGKVNIDTGAVLLSTDIVRSLFSLISTDGEIDSKKFDKYVNETARISFYADFLYPLAQQASLEQFYKEAPEGEFSDELTACRTEIWTILHKYCFKLIALSPAEFIHFGTTKELLLLVTEKVKNYYNLDWASVVNANVSQKVGYSCNNAYIQTGAKIGNNSYLEDSYIMGNCVVGENAIVSNITIFDEIIPANTVVHCVKQKNDKFVVRIYGLEDNPKSSAETATLFGQPLMKAMQKVGVSYDDLWDFSGGSLWNARLYFETDSLQESLKFALNLYEIVTAEASVREFKKAKRISLFESFDKANVSEILPWQLQVDIKVKAFQFINAVKSGKTTAEIKALFSHNSIGGKRVAIIEKAADCEDFSTKIRIYYTLSKIAKYSLRDRYDELCFKTIREKIYAENITAISMPNVGKIVQENVIVKLPVRVNFGGGWSDTPPYCIEHGGTVLNAAISLNGDLPIKVEIKRIDKPVIILASTDSGAYMEFSSIAELRDCGNPFDAFALHKAALLACGVIPLEGDIEFSKIIQKIGGGLYLSTEVKNIPRGSGLGTSSILAGACVKGLYLSFGLPLTDSDSFSRVLIMEQLMSTGGGWQDQVGGMIDGFKFITTQSGVIQEIEYAKLSLKKHVLQELNNRFALIYTGQRRLARNLLRDIVGNYLGNNSDTLYSLSEIQKTAALMRFELERGNIDAFARLMNEHWELSKMLDKGCTNTCIEQIFSSIADLIDGRMICGAGGGGFLQVVLKTGVTKEQLSERLTSVFQDSGVDCWFGEFA